ncbi:hypothetical protein [Thermococcus sp.]
MPGFFTPVTEVRGIKPFDDFPLEFGDSTLSAVVSTDELAFLVFLHTFMASSPSGSVAYYLGPGRFFSLSILQRLDGDSSNVLIGNVYSMDELLEAINYVENGSSVFVAQFPLLRGVTPEKLVELRRASDEGALKLVLGHHAVVFNELDLPGEFVRLFHVPELFDALIVLRTSSYRGHYKLNVTVLKAPPEQVSMLGDHSIGIDGLVRRMLGK